MWDGSDRIRILLVDDHPIVRAGIKACLMEQRDMECIDEASDGAEAVEKALALLPDIVLMDISMPGMNGLEATDVINRTLPTVMVIAMTMHNNRNYLTELTRLGAKGYVLKDAPPDELIRVIRAVHAGPTSFITSPAELLLNRPGDQLHESSAGRELSDREQTVLVLIAEGCNNREIADRLGISIRTVEAHREHIMRKLDIHNIAGLTKYALAQGMVGGIDETR